jgi:hypothetical protein
MTQNEVCFISLQGEDKIIHPILSTGTKIWHLRDESIFYPKYNFNSAISKIPDGATTIFCFGEIDCREALLLCVEKGKYDASTPTFFLSFSHNEYTRCPKHKNRSQYLCYFTLRA